MKSLDLATIVLLIVGGLNWGLVGVADWDLWQIGRLVSGRHGWGGALHAA
jgi:uncharacterized membrane protein YuzA (DUF378 family)